MIWALERRAPSIEYLLFADQPPGMMPYTARLDTAKMKRMPMSRFGAADELIAVAQHLLPPPVGRA